VVGGASGVRWGVLSTARIAASNFLPSLRAAGGGSARAVASRSLQSAEEFARKQDIERPIEGYEGLLEADDIDAVYIPLPNSLHAEWTIKALQAGKAVLCEKPLACSLAEAEQVLTVARDTGRLLWEAFVFPFHEQTHRIVQILESGEIGEIGEIRAHFNAQMTNPKDVRWDPQLAGGALNDIGCYCVHLGTTLLGETPTRAVGMETLTERGVDETTQAILEYPSGRRLTLSSSFALQLDTGATIGGTGGHLYASNPFHARSRDYFEVVTGKSSQRQEYPSTDPTFTSALRHINAAIMGQEEPRHLALTDGLPTATGMELIRRSAR
jgi:predicted dehydrogenase